LAIILNFHISEADVAMQLRWSGNEIHRLFPWK